MDQLVALGAARQSLETALREIGPDQWGETTPCEEWSVRDLVHHLVGGNLMTELLLQGASSAESTALFADDLLGTDPVGAFVDSANRQEAAFAVPGALEVLCHHPIGDVTGLQVLGFRIGDLTLHKWDLAQAIGSDETLATALVEVVWENLQPIAPFIGEVGVFGPGPSGDVDEQAPLQRRLLDLTGRRPSH